MFYWQPRALPAPSTRRPMPPGRRSAFPWRWYGSALVLILLPPRRRSSRWAPCSFWVPPPVPLIGIGAGLARPWGHSVQRWRPSGWLQSTSTVTQGATQPWPLDGIASCPPQSC